MRDFQDLQSYKMKLQPFRILDIKDLMIMTYLVQGNSQLQIARNLDSSASNISVRLNRYAIAFGDDFFIFKQDRRNRTYSRRLSEKGIYICEKAQKVMNFLLA